MLSALILIPLLGSVTVGLIPDKEGKLTRQLALFFAIAVLLVNGYVGWHLDTEVSGFQFTEYVQWVEWIGLNYNLGIDGLSFPLICLNSLLTLIAIFVTDKLYLRALPLKRVAKLTKLTTPSTI